MSAPPPRRRPPPARFQPRFSLLVFYFVVCFFVYALMLVLPELMNILETTSPGPEQEEIATEAARQALGRTQLLTAFIGATLTVAIGAYYRVLPGLRGE